MGRRMADIGILTFSSNTNYGSILQSYALHHFIEENNVIAEIIDYRYRECDENEENVSIIGLKKIFENHYGKLGFYSYIFNRGIRQFRFRKMLKNAAGLSKKKYTSENIEETNGLYKTFMIGSDLVWDRRYCGSSYNFFLDFAHEEKKKYSYAASCGYSSIPENEIDRFKYYLNRFDAITVRETGFKRQLEEKCNIQSTHVSDPTMLLPNEEWVKFVNSRRRPEKYVLVYMTDPHNEIYRKARRYSRKNNLKLWVVTDWTQKNNQAISPHDLREFLSLIYYAERVFTGSYHGILFCVYFKKNFAYCKRKPVNRIEQLEVMLGIEKQEIHNKEYSDSAIPNWDIIKSNEEEWRDFSRGELMRMLNIDEKHKD